VKNVENQLQTRAEQLKQKTKTKVHIQVSKTEEDEEDEAIVKSIVSSYPAAIPSPLKAKRNPTQILSIEELEKIKRDFLEEVIKYEKELRENSELDADEVTDNLIDKFLTSKLDKINQAEEVCSLKRFISEKIEDLASIDQKPPAQKEPSLIKTESNKDQEIEGKNESKSKRVTFDKKVQEKLRIKEQYEKYLKKKAFSSKADLEMHERESLTADIQSVLETLRVANPSET
jgi:hypothetical protein